MKPLDYPTDFHPQDWIIIVEALAHRAGAPNVSIAARRQRAYDLIDGIATGQGLPVEELLKQGDSKWPRG